MTQVFDITEFAKEDLKTVVPRTRTVTSVLILRSLICSWRLNSLSKHTWRDDTQKQSKENFSPVSPGF